MKRGSTIKMFIVAASLCVTAWRLPSLLDRIDNMSSNSPLGAIGGLLGGGGNAANAALPDSLAGILGAHGVAVPGGEPDQKEMVVISPDGKKLSDEELERLKKQAEALAPKPIDGLDGKITVKRRTRITDEHGNVVQEETLPIPGDAEEMEKRLRELAEKIEGLPIPVPPVEPPGD